MGNVIQFNLNAYSLKEIAKVWECSERALMQLAIDGVIRLAVRVHTGTLMEFDEEGNEINDVSIFPFFVGSYVYLTIDDVIDLDHDGEKEVSIFEDINAEIICYKRPVTVKISSLRLMAADRERIEQDNIPYTVQKQTIINTNKSEWLTLLNQASLKFWNNADCADKSTWSDNKTVANWLVSKGYSKRCADAGATIIRPKWAETGRPPN